MAEQLVLKVEIDKSDSEIEVDFPPTSFRAKRTRHNNVIAPWQPCVKLNSDRDGKMCTIKYVSDGKEKEIPTFEIANNSIPLHGDIKKIGTRVIARHRSAYLPYVVTNHNRRVDLIASRNNEFYAGIIAREYNADEMYCVFFDDGVVALVERQYIRCVEDNTFDHAHLNARSYFKFYTSQIQYEIAAKVQMQFSTELNGALQIAKVVKVDRILIQIHFEQANRFEWIYVGSPRIKQLYRQLIKGKKLDGIIEFKTYTACRTADVVMVDPFEIVQVDNDAEVAEAISTINQNDNRTVKEHNCGHECVRSEDMVNLESFGLFRRPILAGWKRSTRLYQAPCGLRLCSYADIMDYLMKTKSKLHINCFDFSKSIDPSRTYDQTIKINDISRGAEKIPISVNEEMTLEDRSFNYILNYKLDYVDVELKSNLQRTGCDCTDNCQNKAKCSCWQLTVQRSLNRTLEKDDLKNKNIGYKNMRLQNIVSSGIVECAANCKCCVDKCVNRIVQHGLQHELELFKTTNRGWGVRTKTDLPPGVFICNYAGDILEESVADKRSTKYQFKVPASAGDNDSDDDENGPNAEPRPKRSKHLKRYDVIQVMVNYFPPIPGYNTNNYPDSDLGGSKSGGYIIDALNHGNISRFFNHCCDPNLFVQSVYVGDDKRFPEIAFFTRKSIKAGEELTFDYRYEITDGNATACLCGSENCRNRLT